MSNLLLHDYGNYPFSRQLARELAKRGHDVEYVYSTSTQLIQRCEFDDDDSNLKVTGIELLRRFTKYNYLRRRQCEVEHGQRLAAIIESRRPDVVLSANAPLDAQKSALKAAHRVNAKFIFWMQDAISIASRQMLKKKIPVGGMLIGEYYTMMEKELVRTSDRVVLIAEDFLPLVRQWRVDERRTTVIPNWAPLEEIAVQPKDNAWAQAHSLADKFCFIYTGILGLKHNPALFLRLAEAFKENPDVRIVIVSNGETMQWLAEQKAAMKHDNLVLLPAQPAALYPQVLGTADVLLAILNEDAGSYSSPSKVLSYLCARRPLLLAVPADNLSARIVCENNAGLVCAPGDTAQWVSNAKKLYQNKQIADGMAANGRKFAESHFNIEPIATRFEQLIRSTLDLGEERQA